MTSGRLIIHVGAPKCGSSSLQAALSRYPAFTSRDGERFQYAAIADQGALLIGDDLARRAEATLEGAIASDNLNVLAALDDTAIAQLAAKIEEQLAVGSVILSCEGWLERVAQFAALNLPTRINAPVEIIAYVRPQADYLNAAWWQWGAWTPATFEQWVYLTELSSCAWASLLQAWSSLDGVTSVQARLLPTDIVADFFEALACAPPASVAVNRSLPALALRFLQRHRHLRPNAHASEINYVLERALGDEFGPAPWVLPLAHVAHVIEQLRADNLRLKEMLPAASRAAMEADQRWWNAESYAHKIVEPPEPLPANEEELEALASKFAAALLKAERELAELRSRGETT